MTSGSIQIKSGMYYAILNMRDKNGKRKQKWISTGLTATKANRKRAERYLTNFLATR